MARARARALLAALAAACLAPPLACGDASVDPARTLLTLSKTQYDALTELPILSPVPLTGAWVGGHTFRVTAEMAMDIINSQQFLLPGYRLNSSWFDDRCDADYNVQQVLQRWNDGAWVAMGGNGCSAPCRSVALIAPKIRLPYISYGCAAGALADTKTLPDFGRFAVDENTVANVYQSLAQAYNWTRMVIITGDPTRYDGPAQAIMNFFVNSTTTQVEWLNPHNPSWTDLKAMMQKVKQSGQRIIIVLGYEAFYRQVVCASMVVGMSPGVVWLSLGVHQDGWWAVQDASLLALEPRCTGPLLQRYANGAIGADGLGAPLEGDMDKPLPCMPGYTPRSFRALVATAFVQGYPVGRNIVPGVPYSNAQGYAVDGICMWAFMLRRMLVNNSYTVSDLVRPNATTYKKMRDYIKTELDFSGVSGRIRFQGNSVPGIYGVSQVQQGKRLIVATVDLNLNLAFVAGSQLMWGDNSTNPGTYFPFCPDGSWRRPDGACELCAAGTYQDPASHECVPCPMGKFSAGTGAVGTKSCRRCASGEVANTTGSSACRECPPGTFADPADDEAVSCTLCPKGQHQSMAGTSECGRCELGRFQPGLGRVECEPCPLRQTTQFLGAISVEECACPAGTFSRPDLGCVDCLEGMECRGGQDPPLQEPGYWADVLDATARDYSVFRCRNIRECPSGAAGSCPPGRGGRSCARCEPGHYPANGGTCSPCRAGDTMGPYLAGAAAVVVSVACAAMLFSRPALQPLSTLTLTILLGQIAGAVQSLGAINQFQIQWVEPIRSILRIMGLLTFDFDVVRISCAFPKDSAVFRLISQLLALPLVLAALGATSIATWAFRHRRRRLIKEKAASSGASAGKGRSWNPEPFANVAGMLTLAVFIPLTLATTNAMRCVGNPNGTKTMASNPGVVCWASSEHQALIALSSVGIIVFPVTTLAVVIRATLYHESWLATGAGLVKLRWHRFLFDRFTPARFKFGLCYLSRSTSISLVPVIFVGQPMLQIMAMVLIFLVSLILQVSWWPWRTILANYTDLLANAALTFFLAASAFLLDVDVEQAKEALQVLLLAALSVVGTALLAGVSLALQRRLCAKKPYAMFLCHHKAGAGVLCRYIKLVVWRSSKAEAFLDSDQLEDLQDIVDAVRCWTRNLVVVLTKDLLKRIWCASEIVSAHLNKIPAVCLVCDDFVPMEVTERRLSEWWSQDQQLQALAPYGLNLEMVEAAYAWLEELKHISMQRFGCLEQKASSVDALMEACSVRRLGKQATGGAAKDAEVVVLGAVGEAESLSVCEVVALMLQFQLQAETAVIRNAKDAAAAVSGSAIYALVVLSRSLLSDVAFAESLLLIMRTPSHRDPVEVVTVLASGLVGDEGFAFPDARFYAELTERGLGHLSGQEVVAAYREMLLILALPLSPLGSNGLIEKQLSEISRRFRKLHQRAGSDLGKSAADAPAAARDRKEGVKEGATTQIAPQPQVQAISWDLDCTSVSTREIRPVAASDWADEIVHIGI